jgi:hypothetical protein
LIWTLPQFDTKSSILCSSVKWPPHGKQSRLYTDCVVLKRSIHVPVSAETYRAVEQLEAEIRCLRLALLRRNPPYQMELPMEVAKEGEQKGDVAS